MSLLDRVRAWWRRWTFDPAIEEISQRQDSVEQRLEALRSKARLERREPRRRPDHA